MREILFKGQRVVNKKWVEGYLFKQFNNSAGKDDCYIRRGDTDYLVIPETVGQYTSLTDKNGKKIYEGDVLQSGKRIVRVRWNGETLCWECTDVEVPDNEVNHLTNTFELGKIQAESCYGEMITIIVGNINDNPELLGGDPE